MVHPFLFHETKRGELGSDKTPPKYFFLVKKAPFISVYQTKSSDIKFLIEMKNNRIFRRFESDIDRIWHQ